MDNKRHKHIKKSKKKKSDQLKIHRNDFPLSINNRLTRIYKTDTDERIVEITCISLEIRVKSKWKTIMYYDSSHDGILHRHTYVSLKNNTDVVDYVGIRKKGSQKRLLQWAIDDIKKNYVTYKKQYIKRSMKLDIDIDFY